MDSANYRQSIAEYISAQAQPPDKFEHQPRLYALAKRLGAGHSYDDDVLYAAAWMHDLGVFAGHRPDDPTDLAFWDHVAYALARTPDLLRSWGFPQDKIPAVLETIRTHLPSRRASSIEGTLLRDADILEQLGAIGIVRMVSKVGRDTRYPTHRHALLALKKSCHELPQGLELPLAREMALDRVRVMETFFQACASESQGSIWCERLA